MSYSLHPHFNKPANALKRAIGGIEGNLGGSTAPPDGMLPSGTPAPKSPVAAPVAGPYTPPAQNFPRPATRTGGAKIGPVGQ